MSTSVGSLDTKASEEGEQATSTAPPEQIERPTPMDVLADEKQAHETAFDPFEVRFDAQHDPCNPHHMSKLRKWTITLIVSCCSLNVTCSSSIYTSTYAQITKEFGCSEIVAVVGLSLFVFGLGLSSMVLAPLTEFYGRKPIYIYAYGTYALFTLQCALAKNTETMLVGRFFAGFAGSAFLSVSGGTVSDMFSGADLSLPMMFFTAAPFLGPEVGPLAGGFINQYLNWRWTFWVVLIWAGILWIILIITPETYNPIMLKRKAMKRRSEIGDDRWYAPIERHNKSIPRTIAISCMRPFQLLAYERIVLLLCTYASVLLGILYLFFGAFGLVFRNNHDFTLSQVGLSFLGMFIGMITAVMTDPLWRKNYIKLVAKRGEALPEFRLPPAILGGIAVTIGIFWFSFTLKRSVHWIVPIIGSSFFGFGTLLTFGGIFTYIVAAYPLYAASALATSSFERSCFAAVFPLFGPYMYAGMGYTWASALLAFVTLAMAPLPYIFFKYGERIRQTSRYAKSSPR